MKLFIELPDLLATGTSEKKIAHDLKKHRQHYFSLYTLRTISAMLSMVAPYQ